MVICFHAVNPPPLHPLNPFLVCRNWDHVPFYRSLVGLTIVRWLRSLSILPFGCAVREQGFQGAV